MCRLLATLSVTPQKAAPLLYDLPNSLFQQSLADPRRLQSDGWGIGHIRGKVLKIYKSSRPLYQDRGALVHYTHSMKSRALVGHVRWASNPLRLPKTELIGLVHTQPFSYRSWIFAHNGTLYIPREARAALGDLGGLIKGNNDSEVLFYWLMQRLGTFLDAPRPALPNLAVAVRESLVELQTLWKKCRARYPLYRHPFHGVNWVLSNGRTLLAFCYVDPGGFGTSRALGRRSQPYYQLQRRTTRQGVLIASEPLDNDSGWKAFRHGELFMATRHATTLTTSAILV